MVRRDAEIAADAGEHDADRVMAELGGELRNGG
jgi:hypothetical protein